MPPHTRGSSMLGFSRQPCAERRRQIGHRAEIESPFRIERTINLRSAIGRARPVIPAVRAVLPWIFLTDFDRYSSLRSHLDR